MKTVFTWGCASMLVLLLSSSEVFAAPIGFFSFDVDADPNIGPYFTVENLSDPGTTFADVTIQLFAGLTLVNDLILGDLDPFGLIQSLDDLRPFTFDAAVLRFGFLDTLQAIPLTGLSFLCDAEGCSSPLGGPVSSAIEVSTDPVPAPVPEPSSLLLLGTGLGVIARAVRRRREA